MQLRTRSDRVNLVEWGIFIVAMIEKSETVETSEKIIRTFISEKLHFAASNLDRIKFSNAHRLPRKTSAIASSTSVIAPPIVVKFLTKDRNSILNLAPHARQFKCSITKHLPLVMQSQRRTLLNTANSTSNESESSGKLSTQAADSADAELASKSLTICHLNARRIFAYNSSLKLVALSAITDLYGFDIICVTETWLEFSATNPSTSSRFFFPFRLDRIAMEAQFWPTPSATFSSA